MNPNPFIRFTDAELLTLGQAVGAAEREGWANWMEDPK